MFVLRRIIIVIVAVIITIAAIAGGYLIYLHMNSVRIADMTVLPVSYRDYDGEISPERLRADGDANLKKGVPYRALTYNVGFGAYDHDFSFFMSESKTLEGDDVKGLMSRAASKDEVRKNIAAAADVAAGQRPDFAIFQEVDVSADRSYSVDEMAQIAGALHGVAFGEDGGGFLAYTYATNFHTGYLFWPPARPMGKVKDSGVATFGRYFVSTAERRSLPVDESFLGRLSDLDRCFSVMRIPVSGADGAEDAGGDVAAPGTGGEGGELVLVNVHLSAYDAGEKMHGAQMETLAKFMKEERGKGNWVIAGGDWNQCFPGSVDIFKGRMEVPGWAKPFKEGALPEGYSLVGADNADIIATCRDTSIPWMPGVSYETILDGWVVSDNVEASAENIDTDYTASDHNPVLLTFTLR
ncbi:MAG: endonuclease [Clostridiales Family XIII bacterium]|nr:endonuclease [Clostridiales Family XIII bacterium]